MFARESVRPPTYRPQCQRYTVQDKVPGCAGSSFIAFRLGFFRPSGGVGSRVARCSGSKPWRPGPLDSSPPARLRVERGARTARIRAASETRDPPIHVQPHNAGVGSNPIVRTLPGMAAHELPGVTIRATSNCIANPAAGFFHQIAAERHDM